MNKHMTIAPCVLWLTGLSGAGKTTFARALEEALLQLGSGVSILDGDELRKGLCSDLGYSEADRLENIRRAAEVARLLLAANNVVIVAMISPLEKHRVTAKRLLSDWPFFEGYCSAPLDVCEQRDVKGLYRRAREGLLAEFTGISSPYEVPSNPDLIIDTSGETLLKVSVEKVLTRLGFTL